MKIKLLSLIFILILINSAYARLELPELATKQAINNLRFISSDGNFTYYQNRDGALLLSTNYKVKEVVSSSPGTNYEIISSPERKVLIVTQQDSFHRYLGVRQVKTIYKLDFGGLSLKKLGEGIDPKLHDSDEWVSFYHPITKIVKFINLKSSALTFEISIKNNFNPYFIPEIVMVNKNTILMTDLNAKGIPGVLYYDKITKALSVLYKASNAATKLELCLGKDKLILGEFGLDRMYSGSIISELKKSSIDFSKRNIIYESPLNDIGNIYCESSIIFIKNLSKEKGKLGYEVAEIKEKEEGPKILSDVNFANHIVNMDGVFLLPHLGKYYVLKGKADFTKTDLLKQNINIKGKR